MAGAAVTFTAPARGPSGRFTTRTRKSKHSELHVSHPRSVTIVTDACGIAVAPAFVANDEPGRLHRQGQRRARQAGGVRARQRGARTAAVNTAVDLAPRRLRASDLARVASVGLRTRRLRAGLSALGIAIGVAAIVAVLGLSSSSQAGLLSQIDRLGTNLLTVTNGQGLTGKTAELSLVAPAMIARIDPVTSVAETGKITANVYRTPLVPAIDTNALSVQAASLDLLGSLGVHVIQGRYLNAATATEPVAVLGYTAAQRLGIDRLYAGERIWVETSGSTSPASSARPNSPPRSKALCSWASPPPRSTSPSTGIPTPSTCAPRTNRSRPCGRCSRRPPTRKRPTKSTSASRPRRSSRARTPRARSTACSWDSARSRCWSARSAWRTSWSSPCWNAARRSACAARSARPRARSARSSSPRRS